MYQCPNMQIISLQTMKCALIPGKIFASPYQENGICSKCQKEWLNETHAPLPNKENWNSVLESMSADQNSANIGVFDSNDHINMELGHNVNIKSEDADKLEKIIKDKNLKSRFQNYNRIMRHWAKKSHVEEVSSDELEHRIELCLSCEQWNGNCKLSCCGGLRIYIKSSKCPDKPPRWEAVK